MQMAPLLAGQLLAGWRHTHYHNPGKPKFPAKDDCSGRESHSAGHLAKLGSYIYVLF